MEVDIEKVPQDITYTENQKAKGNKERLDLKERLINLKVDLIQVPPIERMIWLINNR